MSTLKYGGVILDSDHENTIGFGSGIACEHWFQIV